MKSDIVIFFLTINTLHSLYISRQKQGQRRSGKEMG